MKLLRLVIFLLCILLIFSACGGGSSVTPDPQDNNDEQVLPPLDNGLVRVKMNPAPIQNPPFIENEFTKVVSTPSELQARLLPPRTLSFLPGDLIREGGSFDASLPMSRVMQSGPGNTHATFNPIWEDPTDPLGNAAYAIYRFPLQDYGMTSNEQTLGWSWADAAPAMGDLWIGFGNLEKHKWEWFEGEEDGVLSVDSYNPYEAADGTVLCAIVLLGTQEVVLESLQIGEFETRGTGGEDDTAIQFAFPPSMPLPDFPLQINLIVDLSSGCAPIGDQGSTGSCTAFATANGALNYEMNRLYGDCGWNFDVPLNRASPRFVYNQTAVDLGGSCPSGGRTTNDVGTWLLTNGAASEFNAPIGSVSPSNTYNCNTNWSAAALADAALMHPTSKHFIGTYNASTEKYYLDDADINTVRSILRVCRLPVVFRSNLDSGFSAVNYAAGGSWTYAGPKTGGHAMLIVGYDDDRNGGSFKVRNSWGTNWGDQGYCWITYDSMQGPAGVYAFYMIGNYSSAAEDRFCPEPPVFLPPFDIVFEPIPGPIVFSFQPIPDVERFILYKDNQEEPYAFISQKNEEDPLVFEDLQVDDFYTHVYWIQAVGGNDSSPLSRPFFCWREPSIPPT